MKRVLSIQDISCLGKCSLTIALPLISAMGSECVILPTALLSTHTMFKGYTCLDLADRLMPITEHWAAEGVHFDAICTGYLGTEEEIDFVRAIFRRFGGESCLLFVDPAMGDHGRLYPAFDPNYAKANAALAAEADVIVPNITEAAFMTGLPYREDYDASYIEELLRTLLANSKKAQLIAVTGVSLSEGKTGFMGLDGRTGEFFAYQNRQIPVSYHGTGDIFSSVTVGGLMRGLSMPDALTLAADYTARTIDVTRRDPKEPWYGVNFEETIPELCAMLEQALS